MCSQPSISLKSVADNCWHSTGLIVAGRLPGKAPPLQASTQQYLMPGKQDTAILPEHNQPHGANRAEPAAANEDGRQIECLDKAQNSRAQHPAMIVNSIVLLFDMQCTTKSTNQQAPPSQDVAGVTTSNQSQPHLLPCFAKTV